MRCWPNPWLSFMKGRLLLLLHKDCECDYCQLTGHSSKPAPKMEIAQERSWKAVIFWWPPKNFTATRLMNSQEFQSSTQQHVWCDDFLMVWCMKQRFGFWTRKLVWRRNCLCLSSRAREIALFQYHRKDSKLKALKAFPRKPCYHTHIDDGTHSQHDDNDALPFLDLSIGSICLQ